MAEFASANRARATSRKYAGSPVPRLDRRSYRSPRHPLTATTPYPLASEGGGRLTRGELGGMVGPRLAGRSRVPTRYEGWPASRKRTTTGSGRSDPNVLPVVAPGHPRG